jgi:hypothetical protein
MPEPKPLTAEELDELATLFRNTTPGKWKLLASAVMADQAGDSDVEKAVLVARTYYVNSEGRRRTNDAEWIATAQRRFESLLQAARERDELAKRLSWFEAAHTLCAHDGAAFIGSRDGNGIHMFYVAEGANYEPLLCVLCSDTFGYGCADAEAAEYVDAPALLHLAKTEGWPGIVRWVQKRREVLGEQTEPIGPVKKSILEFDALRKERDDLIEFLRTHGPDIMLYLKPQVEGLKRPCRDALGKMMEKYR